MSTASFAGPLLGQSQARQEAGGSHLRLSAVDHLRGLVMMLMVLDHSREFFMNSRIDPTNLATTYPSLFLTRWVTHFCAPVFVFLAGTGAFLAQTRGKSKSEMALFLVTRGLWLIVLELTLVKLGWMFRFDTSLFLLQVIWVIGASMILLAALVFLPVWVVGVIGLTILIGHNIFDGKAATGWLRALGWGSMLIRPGVVQPLKGTTAIVAYSLIPWFGVMAAGYAFGPVMLWPHHRRRRVAFGIGVMLTLAFLALRTLNVYGDPTAWSTRAKWTMTIVSFLNCQKYPPSLLFVLMTLGPALTLLAWFDGGTGVLGRRLVTLGRVPLFFYLLQWPLVHALAILLALARGEPVAWFFKDAPFTSPEGYGYGLGTVYLGWGVAILLLYPLCRWFAKIKHTRRDWWLSYL